MQPSESLRKKRRDMPRSIIICLVFLLSTLQGACAAPVAYANDSTSVDAEYRDITKRILLAIIEIERFSLRYRLDSAREPKTKRLRYFLAQETGAATGLASECILIDQLKEGRRRPLTINKRAVKGGLRTVFVGSIIAGAGSGLELASNSIHAIKSYKAGIDPRSANQFMVSHMKQLDILLAERESFLSRNTDHPYFKQATIESKLLRMMRHAVVFEYSKFQKDLRAFRARENVFYAMNVLTNSVGAVSSHYAIKGVDVADKNGPANILFTVSGALTTISPLVSSAAGKVTKKVAGYQLKHMLGEEPKFDYAEFNAVQQEFSESLKTIGEEKVTGAIYRAGAYLEGSERSHKLIENETKVMRYLDQVAVQNAIIGPAIGGTLLAQGIAGTVGFYKYHPQLKELDLSYKGAVAGAVGTGAAVGLTAVGLIADWTYERRLEKKRLLPRQIIDDLLTHLDEVEKKISAM